MGHATDSAGFQLAAASSLMSPNLYLLNLGVLYLTFGVGESIYSAPYLGYLPSIAYLDYDHEMRLFLSVSNIQLLISPCGQESVQLLLM